MLPSWLSGLVLSDSMPSDVPLLSCERPRFAKVDGRWVLMDSDASAILAVVVLWKVRARPRRPRAFLDAPFPASEILCAPFRNMCGCSWKGCGGTVPRGCANRLRSLLCAQGSEQLAEPLSRTSSGARFLVF